MAAAHVRIERDLPGIRALLHAASLAQGQMVHVASNLSSYVMFEVLETEWRGVAKKIEEATDMDAMIRAHDVYIHNVFAKALLLESEAELAELLRRVLEAIGSFCNCQNALFADAFGELARRRAEARDGGVSPRSPSITSPLGPRNLAPSTLEGDWDDGVPQRFLDSIRNAASAFEDALKRLILALEEDTKGAEMLKTMAYRLDFNGYYSRAR
uniref:Gamma tubulin complex component C-terminal domain-containing protein n=2 Tax=Phaeomonas parva TaxID=124430 RepID=A0A7S1XYT4_9STRA|mmetsp:Transcript_45200/g.141654  ORF Transcript_45200/g.141654 Transcript_45200/m.141654 type:complete len:213 (+) Transcript_45200:625-1263(+)